jgi:hypothetical protein
VTVENGVETYSTGAAKAGPSSAATAPIKMEAPPAEPEKEEEDDLSIPVADGARCKRRACGATWEGEDVSRGDGEKAPSGCKFTIHFLELALIHSPCSTKERNTMLVAQNAKYWNSTNS